MVGNVVEMYCVGNFPLLHVVVVTLPRVHSGALSIILFVCRPVHSFGHSFPFPAVANTKYMFCLKLQLSYARLLRMISMCYYM